MKAKKIIGRLLLTFVLVSIGFAIGKETAISKGRSAVETAVATGDKVVVYYMHASFRCVTCNLVETMGGELIRSEFAAAVKDGRLEWKPVNCQDNDDLARRYNVGGNMIIVARFAGGREVEHKRLDRVMELADKRDEFMAYVRSAIQELLEAKT